MVLHLLCSSPPRRYQWLGLGWRNEALLSVLSFLVFSSVLSLNLFWYGALFIMKCCLLRNGIKTVKREDWTHYLPWSSYRTSWYLWSQVYHSFYSEESHLLIQATPAKPNMTHLFRLFAHYSTTKICYFSAYQWALLLLRSQFLQAGLAPSFPLAPFLTASRTIFAFWFLELWVLLSCWSSLTEPMPSD